MRNLHLWFLTLFLFVSVSPCTNSRQTTSKASEESIVVLSRRVDGQLLRYVGTNPQNEADTLTQLSHLCREPGRSHDVVSMMEDSSSVSDLFDALKLVQQAKCDGKVGTAFVHDGKVYQVKITEIGCSPKELMTAVLTPTDPGYAETVELTRELENHGFVVGCVLQSKMVGTFEGQLGAALYRTSRGDFEALFLPKPHTFASLRLIERLKNGRYPLYSYSFEGTPRSPVTEGTPRSPVTFNCARRTFFSRRANRFFVTEDKQLAANLGEILIPN